MPTLTQKTTSGEYTLCFLRFHQGQTETVIALIDNGADIEAKDDSGETPLHWAVERGQTETAIALINRGADINAKSDNDGEYAPA